MTGIQKSRYLTYDQVYEEREKIEDQHDDDMKAADGRRAIKLKELQDRCPHTKNEFGHCGNCLKNFNK